MREIYRPLSWTVSSTLTLIDGGVIARYILIVMQRRHTWSCECLLFWKMGNMRCDASIAEDRHGWPSGYRVCNQDPMPHLYINQTIVHRSIMTNNWRPVYFVSYLEYLRLPGIPNANHYSQGRKGMVHVTLQAVQIGQNFECNVRQK